MARTDRRTYAEWRFLADKANPTVTAGNVYLAKPSSHIIAESFTQPEADYTCITLQLARAIQSHCQYRPSVIIFAGNTACQMSAMIDAASQDQHVIQMEINRGPFPDKF